MTPTAAALLLCLGVTACSVTTPFPQAMAIDCGPVSDRALCEKAVAIALAAQLNPPPAASVAIRVPRAGDDCRRSLQPCGAGSVIAVIQSGDTLQDVPLQRTADGWVRLDAVR